MKTVNNKSFDFKKYFICVMLLTCIGITSCRKDKTPPENNDDQNTKQTPTTDRVALTNDSLFLYAKQVYYWNESLPSYDVYNPRQYTSGASDLNKYENNLLNIVKASNSPDYLVGNPFPKYSYIFDKTDKNPISSIPASKMSVDLEGNGNDLGIRLGYYGTETDYDIFVSAVYPNSPAEHAGFKRGDKITNIAGVSYGSNFSLEISRIEGAMAQQNVSLKGLRSGIEFTTSVAKGIFSSSPIYKDTVFTAGARKIGYLSYARFSDENNSLAALNSVFADFASNGVTDLIVDLRYNGGGYINTAQHMINLIAPSGTNGVMFAEYFNATMRDGKATILKNQPSVDDNGRIDGTYFDGKYTVDANTTTFKKEGSLAGVRNVVFIVTRYTASASELVINSLKPYITVKLVGETSYGKPVGFFPITIENRYDVFFAMFETKNSKGEGGYFNGIIPDVSAGELVNGVMYDFGNPNDNCTAKAINILAPGVKVAGQIAAIREKSTTSAPMLGQGAGKEFIGMIENRKSKQ